MIVIWLTYTLLGISLVGFFRHIWWFTVLDFFRLQYAVAAIVLLFISLFQNDFISALLNFATLAINIFRIRHFLWRSSSKNEISKRQIMSINAYKDNFNLKKLYDVVQKADPDILLIMEMTKDTKEALSDVLENYSHSLKAPVRDGFRICLLSKNNLSESKITWHGPGDTPLLQAKIEIEGKIYQVFCAHPKPALNQDWYNQREIYFEAIEKTISESNLPVLVLGDFNSVPWESQFQKFLKKSNLKTTLQGFGYQITWPAVFPLLGIPMDHILITCGESYSNLCVGPHSGSDHYPVSINLKS